MFNSDKLLKKHGRLVVRLTKIVGWIFVIMPVVAEIFANDIFFHPLTHYYQQTGGHPTAGEFKDLLIMSTHCILALVFAVGLITLACADLQLRLYKALNAKDNEPEAKHELKDSEFIENADKSTLD